MLIVVIFVLFCSNIYASERNIQLENNLNNSVFLVFNESKEGKFTWGTGFFINENNYAVTNYHVVKDNSKLYIGIMRDKNLYNAKIVKADESLDLALIYVYGAKNYGYIDFENECIINELAYTLGFPQDINTNRPKYTSSTGNIIEKNKEYKDNYYIRINNNVRKGNSGGPALNINNNCVGIVTMGKENDTYLIPASVVQNFVSDVNMSSKIYNLFIENSKIPYNLKYYLV